MLEDEAAIRTISLKMESSYWDKGGWSLDSCNHSDEIEPLIPIDRERLISEVVALGYNIDGLTEDSYTVGPKHADLCLSVADPHQNALIYGTITVRAGLSESFTPSGHYSWFIDVDDSAIDVAWDITGTWYGELYKEVYGGFLEPWKQSEYKDYYLTVDFLSLEQRYFSDTPGYHYALAYQAQLEYDHHLDAPNIRAAVHNGSENLWDTDMRGNGPLDWHLEICIGCVSFFRMDIYLDKAVLWEGNFDSHVSEDWQSTFERID